MMPRLLSKYFVLSQCAAWLYVKFFMAVIKHERKGFLVQFIQEK